MEKYCFNSQWESQQIEGDVILYNNQSNIIVTVNESGQILLELLKNNDSTFAEIFELYSNIYEITPEIEQDLFMNINRFVELGVLEKYDC